MKIGIIAAMEQEVIALVRKLKNHVIIKKANQTFYDGNIFGREVTIVQSGIGKVNAAIASALLIENFHVDAVVNTGSAGGIGQGLSIGDLVVSTKLAYNDADARVFGYEFGQIPQMPLYYKANEQLIEQLKSAALKVDWKINSGLIVSGDSFIAEKEKIYEMKQYFPDALVTEMEGAAVAQTCYQFEVPFVVVRALSDTADEEAVESFDEFIEHAGQKSAEMILSFLKNSDKLSNIRN